MYVLYGIMLALGGAWTVMYNADIVLGGLLRFAGGIGRLAPIVKMAVSYPLQHRFRTGMALFMFCLVIVALMVQAVLIGGFSARGLNLNADVGGYQVFGAITPSNPIRNAGAQIAANPDLRGRVTAVGSIAPIPIYLRQPGVHVGWQAYRGDIADDAYLASTRFTLHSRAAGYGSDAQVWQTIRTHPGYAVIDSSLLPTRSSAGKGNQSNLKGVYYEDRTFKPFRTEMRDARTGVAVPLTVIGVIDPSVGFFDTWGVYTSQASLAAVHDSIPTPTAYYFRVAPGQNVHQVALALGSAFLPHGLDIQEAQAEYNQVMSLQVGFNNLLEGFVALGLVVGIAALGVIATRSVVERRQQIGMLRAVGFKRQMVQAAFLLESSFVAITGTLVGSALGLVLGHQVVRYIEKTDPGLPFVIPWPQVVLIVVGAYVASLLTTYLPAWQASRIYPAEALRYE
jgi:putative ABC transport system permease protein